MYLKITAAELEEIDDKDQGHLSLLTTRDALACESLRRILKIFTKYKDKRSSKGKLLARMLKEVELIFLFDCKNNCRYKQVFSKSAADSFVVYLHELQKGEIENEASVSIGIRVEDFVRYLVVVGVDILGETAVNRLLSRFNLPQYWSDTKVWEIIQLELHHFAVVTSKDYKTLTIAAF